MSETSDHGALLRNALREIKSLRSALAEARSAAREPIAIIGMGCRFPGGAATPDAFWRLVRSGTDAVTEVPRSRWDVDALYDADPDAPGKMYTRHGGFLDDVDRFDAEFFGVSPLDAMNMDPQQRLLLEVAWEAFEDAGVVPEGATRTGVFVGSFLDDYLQSNFYAADRATIDAYNTLGLLRGLAAGRLAYALNLQGPAMQLDTACSSSLLTAHLACQALRNRECDLALSGGVNLILAPEVTIGLCRMRAMAADGRCKSFDARADGYVRGEGCGVVVLERLSDALAAGRRIYALIRGSAVNHDGRSNGLTAPNGQAQQTLLRAALDAAGVEPVLIQYVEAHGTGTSLGDPIEAIALGEVLGRGRKDRLLIGSVKSNVGHLESAAGAAALMKTALSLHHGEIPPSLHFQQPNPHVPWSRLPIEVAATLVPWPDGEGRFAGVSSFGMSGTNVHMILEGAPPAPAPAADADARSFHALTLSAASAEALDALVTKYVAHLGSEPGPSLRDVCDTSNRGRKHFDHRLAVVADSVASLVASLERGRPASERRRRPRVAFLFPGQGTPLGDAGDSIQATLFDFEVTLARRWMSWGVRPDVVAGHSVGEYAAACIAGVFTAEDGRRLVAERERLMGALPERGAMAALFADEDRVRAAIEPYGDGLSIAALNGSHVVISGRADDVAAVAEGFRARPLTVVNAFHSSLMDPMLDDFEAVVSRTALARPSLAFVSTVTGGPADAELTHPAYWRRHVREPVRFAECLGRLDADVFIEIGPQPTLAAMARSVVDGDVTLLPSFRPGHPEQLLESLAALYERGLDVDWAAVQPKAATVSLPTYPFQDRRFWIARTASRALPGPRKIPFSNETHFEFALSPGSPRYLADHRLGETILVPAGAYLSMALDSLGAAALRDVTFPEPLRVEAPTSLHLVASDHAFRFGTERDGGWITHCTGTYDRDAATPEAGRPEIAGEPIDAGADAGFTIGPSFRWMREARRAGPDVFCRMQAPAGIEALRFHPGLLDSCLRAVSLTLERDGVHVPFHVDALRVFRAPRPAAPLWCQATARGDVRLFEGDSPVLEVEGLAVRKLDRAPGRDADRAPDLPLVRIDWRPAEGAAPDDVACVDVVCASGFGVADLLALRGTPHVRFLTHGALAVREGDRVDPTHAWVWGLANVVAIEQPQWRWRFVDLDPDEPVADQLGLLAGAPREPQVAFREGRAYVPRLVPAAIGQARARFRDDGAYVITGASGVLGGHVARFLIEEGARHLVLVSRTPPRVDDLDADVRVVTADVADPDEVARVFDSPLPIRGIVHAAGVVDDALLADLTAEQFERVFAAKVAGARNLHERSLALDLDFFVCFSSAASLIGSRGQGNYAAANRYLDALMQHRRALGLPGLSINWSAWGEGGMAATAERRLTAMGIELIEPRAGLETLGRLLGSDAAQVGVIVADWSKLLPSLFAEPPPFFADFATVTGQTRPRLVPLLEGTPREERRRLLETHVRELVVSVLGRDAFAAADEEPSFFELGMDSLMSLALRNRLQGDLDRALPSTVAFEHPAVGELVDYLIADVLPAEMFA